jgi:hypothetical protein
MNNNFYISIVERTNEQYHRSKIIIHRPNMFYFAEFDTEKQLNFFAKTIGFSYSLIEEKQSNMFGTYKKYFISHDINDPYSGGFWKKSDLPSNTKPIKALSNGSIVTCFFTNDGESINFYRPNPNAKEVYNPLSLDQHIAHVKTYGLY